MVTTESYFSGIDWFYYAHLPECRSWIDRDLKCLGVCFSPSGGLKWKAPGEAMVHLDKPVLHWHWPGVVFQYGVDPGDSWDHYFVSCDGPRVQRMLDGGLVPSDPQRPYRFVDDPNRIRNLFERILVKFEDPSTSRAEQVHLFEGLLLQLFDKRETARSNAGDVKSRLVAYVDRLAESGAVHIDWHQAAGYLEVSLVHFRRIFREVYGQSPVSWLNERRLRMAAHHIRNSHESLKVTARNCGFEDYTHFIRLFRRAYKLSPGEYRRVGM